MATLQKIRSKGPLLVIVIGLALFAFIAGDAWKVLQPHQTQDVGIINGDALSAQEYQQMVEEYTDVIKFTNGLSTLTDEQNNQIKDEVWQNYVNSKLIEHEAEKLGLTVSNAELQAIIDAGTHPMLQQTPFRSSITGAFDKDMLKKFLVDYANMVKSGVASPYLEYYQSLYHFWSFLEKNLMQGRLVEKYQALLTHSMITNPVEAQASFDARVNQSDLWLAAIPYSAVADSTITITRSEMEKLYNKNKEQYRQYTEARNIKYIDVQVTASPADRAAIQSDVDAAAEQLQAPVDDYTTFIRDSGSETPYVDLFYTTKALPTDVVARLDSVTLGQVCPPYYNAADNTINTFRILERAQMPDSIQFRQIQVVAETTERTAALADSIFQALKGGADFAEMAMRYGQTGELSWVSSANYEGAQLDVDNLSYIKALTTTAPNVLTNLPLSQAHLILQVTARKAIETKYKVAIVKREVTFSKETYSKAYNDFSQFIAANPTLEDLNANAEDEGYRLLDRADLYSSEHGIGSIRGTKEALRWVFSAKPGQVSGLYECGDSDHLLVVALTDIVKEGYRPMSLVSDQLQVELLRDKKAEKLMAEVKAAGVTTIQQYKGMTGAVSDSVKYVTFSAPAFVPSLRSSEPMVSAYASVAQTGNVSQPIKGYGGLLLMQQYATEKSSETYDQAAEEARLSQTHATQAGQFVNDLYLKGKVTDNRYLFF
ncbi:MAG: SurA N-terminal domain-containing protein [Prevotellaceae bacterium]|jgi:peptidyl-prolyl cis-trans isomerase D|nr:SurA N-terminal domain-containing protein [Prevotellaceae bacterium]